VSKTKKKERKEGRERRERRRESKLSGDASKVCLSQIFVEIEGP